MNFVFDKPTFYDIDLNVSPWFPMYNPYDGLSNGIYIKYGGLAGFGGKSIDAWLLYGNRTKRLNGIVWTKKKIQMKRNNYMDLYQKKKLIICGHSVLEYLNL